MFQISVIPARKFFIANTRFYLFSKNSNRREKGNSRALPVCAWRHEARQTGHWSPRPPSSATHSAASAPVGLGPQQGRTPPEAPSAETQLSAWIFMGRFVVPGRYGDRMTQAECSYRVHPGRSVSQRRSPARVRAPSQGTLACPRGPGGRPVNVCLTGE